MSDVDNSETPLAELHKDPNFQWRITKVDGDVSIVMGEAWMESLHDVPMPLIMRSMAKALQGIANMINDQALVDAYEDDNDD